MFSITPTTCRLTLRAMYAARCATFCAAGRGVNEGVGRGRRAAVTVGGVRVAAAVQPRRERGAFLVGHDDEVDVDPGNAGERGDGVGHPLGDLAPEGAARDRQGDRDADPI